MVWVYISCIELLEAVKRSSPLNNMVSSKDILGGSGFAFLEKKKEFFKDDVCSCGDG